MVTNPLLLLGALLLVIVLAIVARRMSRKSTPALPGEVAAAPPGEAPTALPGEAPITAPTENRAENRAEAPADSAGLPSPFLAAPNGPVDDLARIKGIGPKLSARLLELGVFHYRQIAGWTPAQLALVDRQLGQFQGRPERDQWQAQARLLADGDTRAFERTHGKLGPRPDDGGDAA